MKPDPVPAPPEFFKPYLVVRIIPAVHLHIRLSARASETTLTARATEMMERYGRRYRICLVVSPVRCLYLETDGRSSWASIIPFGGIQIEARMKCKFFRGMMADK